MKTKIEMLLLAVLMAGLTACVAPVYTKPGGTQSQFEMDKADCQMRFAASPWATNPFMAAQFGQTCMRSKGYSQIAKGGEEQRQGDMATYLKGRISIPPPNGDLAGVQKYCGTGATASIIIECLNEHGVTYLTPDQYAAYVRKAFPNGVKVDEHGVPVDEADKVAVRKLVWADLPVSELKR